MTKGEALRHAQELADHLHRECMVKGFVLLVVTEEHGMCMMSNILEPLEVSERCLEAA